MENIPIPILTIIKTDTLCGDWVSALRKKPQLGNKHLEIYTLAMDTLWGH